ncbi:MAG: hypothetical protein AYK23_00360 [Candidatus Proteinoplasmatales archaeon SG8-5]|nr:MAG: hypothetical protein AYK23_00360 [Candidatus Proteinoplasmatales archaeon SG8-5]
MTASLNIPGIQRYPIDLVLVIIFTLVGVLTALFLQEGNLLRVAFGLPLLLVIPGYTLTSSLWPEKGLSTLERLALSIGLSIVIVAINGLVTSYLTGLTLTNILVGLVLIIFIFSGIACYRRSTLPMDDRYNLMISEIASRSADSTDKLFSMSIMIMLIMTGCFMAYMLAMPSIEPAYTEFYILDSDGTYGGYPVNISANQTAAIIIGITCHEEEQKVYTITTAVGNHTTVQYEENWASTHSLSADTVLIRNITLVPENSFEDTFVFGFTEPGLYQIDWSLDINGSMTDYKLHIWVNVI